MTVPIEPAETVDAETAVGLLPPGDTVQVLSWVFGRGFVTGAHWPRGDVEKLFRRAAAVDIAGPRARSQGYGLAVWVDAARRCLFFQSVVPESSVRYHHSAPTGAN